MNELLYPSGYIHSTESGCMWLWIVGIKLVGVMDEVYELS